jgi:hypothetical protein
MRAKLTQVGKLEQDNKVNIVYDILKGKDEVVASDLSMRAEPADIVQRVKDVLFKYETNEAIAVDLRVGQVIKSDSGE